MKPIDVHNGPTLKTTKHPEASGAWRRASLSSRRASKWRTPSWPGWCHIWPWMYRLLYTYTVNCIYIYVRTLSGPHFSTFLEMQCFCYIMFDHLCSYTCDGIARDPHRLSDFLRGCQRLPKNVQRAMKIPREKEGGKTHIVCVYTLGERWPRKGSHFFYELPPSPSPPIYSPPIYIDGLAFSL